jgi:hypothetical protein
MNRVGFFIFAAALVIAGCKGELDSSESAIEPGTPNWQLVMTINTALNSSIMQTSVSAALLDASGAAPVAYELQLDAGDSLQVSDGVQTIDLEPTENDSRVYEGTFPTEVVGRDLTVSLTKATLPANVDWWVPTGDSPQPDFNDFFIDAPNTQVRLPQSFEITAPTYIPDPNPPEDGPPDDFREEFPIGTDVTLVWTPSNSGEPLQLIFNAVCINLEDPLGPRVQGPIGAISIEGDPGTYTRKVDDFLIGHADGVKQVEEGCIVRLTLERQIEEGNLTPDPALSTDSSLVARFRRFVEIETVPAL